MTEFLAVASYALFLYYISAHLIYWLLLVQSLRAFREHYRLLDRKSVV